MISIHFMPEIKGKRKTKTILKMTFPKVTPEDGVADFIISKNISNVPKYNFDAWEISRNCAPVHLLAAKYALRTDEEYLRRCRQVAIEKRKKYDEKWDDLKANEEEFRMMFRKFNKFVRENQEKRDRAERKIADEIELQKRRTCDIEKMREDLTSISNIKNLMEKRIKEHRLYEDYLQTVVKTSQSFKNINDLLYRYESLIETKNILCKKQQTSLMALELARANMMKLIEEKTLVLVGLQNQVASLQERYELAYTKSLQWESNVSKIQDVCNHEEIHLHLVKKSIHDTYLAMCKRKNIEPDMTSVDYEMKLAFIKNTLGDMHSVLLRLKSKRLKSSLYSR